MYKCSLCDYTSYYKTHVKDHHNKKNRCSTEIPEIVEIYAEIYCINFIIVPNKFKEIIKKW